MRKGKRRYYLVKWEEVKKPIRQGGVDIRSLVEMNVAVQGKWLWRYLNEVDEMWKKIIAAR